MGEAADVEAEAHLLELCRGDTVECERILTLAALPAMGGGQANAEREETEVQRTEA